MSITSTPRGAVADTAAPSCLCSAPAAGNTDRMGATAPDRWAAHLGRLLEGTCSVRHWRAETGRGGGQRSGERDRLTAGGPARVR